MNYFHVPSPLLAELRTLLTQLEENTDDKQISARATIAKTALSGVNMYINQADQNCHGATLENQA